MECTARGESMKKRIGIAFFYHESNTFSPVKTDMQAFYDEAYYKGQAILSAYRDTKTEVGGFIDVLEQTGHIMVPLLCAAAIPSGKVTASAYDVIKTTLLQAVKEATAMDGLLLALHGAMVVEGVSDPEGELLAEIRAIVGIDFPISATLDMHANVSKRMLDQTPFFFGFKTYPHIDMFEQGVRAAHALLSYLDKNQSIYASFIKLPMMPPSVNMRTEEGPMAELVQAAIEAELDSNIISASVFGGFPYCDIKEAGASVIVVSSDKSKGDAVAQALAEKLWENRQRFVVELPSIQEAIAMSLKLRHDKPVALADIADNPLSGGTGDTTALLRELLEQDVEHVLFGALFDEESLQACVEAGEGAKVMLRLGGKYSVEFGECVEVKAQVIKLSEGRFRNTGPMNTGLQIDTKGAAHIRVQKMDVLLTGRALSANDLELFRHIGLEPSQYKILALKVKNHFRAAFDPIVSEIIYMDGPGLATNQFKHLKYHSIPRPIWPLDEIKGELSFKPSFHIETPDFLSTTLLQQMILLEKEVFGEDGAVDEWGLVPIARHGRLVLLREEGDERPVGVCELLRDYNKPNLAYIYGYYVRNDKQGKGYGKMLFKYVFEMLLRDHFNEVCLTVKPNNIAAVKLYEGVGFTIAETLTSEYGEGSDRYLMVKTL
jgi:microcystin degradation protein MlrC/ribosomal protein S18 acetylase RimI-like enzyme